jgi:hypothetical protein
MTNSTPIPQLSTRRTTLNIGDALLYIGHNYDAGTIEFSLHQSGHFNQPHHLTIGVAELHLQRRLNVAYVMLQRIIPELPIMAQFENHLSDAIDQPEEWPNKIFDLMSKINNAIEQLLP